MGSAATTSEDLYTRTSKGESDTHEEANTNEEVTTHDEATTNEKATTNDDVDYDIEEEEEKGVS